MDGAENPASECQRLNEGPALELKTSRQEQNAHPKSSQIVRRSPTAYNALKRAWESG
jgi:hypothetical protein